MATIIEAKGLTKTYGKKQTAFTALKNIDLSIEEGETVAIVGKSGSGKSTLMHLLALLDTPTSGTVKIDGVTASRLKGKKLNSLRNERFGFVFQQFFMNANDTVLENVMLPLKIGKVSLFKRKELALEALKTVDLADKAKNKATDLSGGQKQRVCIARAIVNNPKVIFADEPTGNLDSGTGDKITDLLFDLAKKQGVTLIIVTHDEDLAKLCDRIVRLSDGEIISDQTVRKDYQEKASEKREKEAARVRRANDTSNKRVTRTGGTPAPRAAERARSGGEGFVAGPATQARDSRAVQPKPRIARSAPHVVGGIPVRRKGAK